MENGVKEQRLIPHQSAFVCCQPVQTGIKLGLRLHVTAAPPRPPPFGVDQMVESTRFSPTEAELHLGGSAGARRLIGGRTAHLVWERLKTRRSS